MGLKFGQTEKFKSIFRFSSVLYLKTFPFAPSSVKQSKELLNLFVFCFQHIHFLLFFLFFQNPSFCCIHRFIRIFIQINYSSESGDQKSVLASLVNENNESLGAPFDLPTNIDTNKLQQICNALLSNVRKDFFIFQNY